MDNLTKSRRPSFVDIFAGCGGLSLGLTNSGWRGLFAIEKSPDAFDTLSHNLLHPANSRFSWPSWLPKKPYAIESFLDSFRNQLRSHHGRLDLLAGGPPCQGFSTFGKRNEGDPRNLLFLHYLQVVELMSPKMILMENVRGILAPFKRSELNKKNSRGDRVAYADLIREALGCKYRIWSSIVHSKDFGVPQKRPRFILIGIRKDLAESNEFDPFETLFEKRAAFLARNGLPARPTNVKDALSDLRSDKSTMYESLDSKGYINGGYGKQSSAYQKLMHDGMAAGYADSHRFAKHLPATREKFQWFLDNCVAGKKIAQSSRGVYRNNKHILSILDPYASAPTVTTLPDDMIHYAEPRILTVREMARLQSFPDWFEFKGKYTTGGAKRTKECPRYTQIGNAVPPLLAEALGNVLLAIINKLDS